MTFWNTTIQSNKCHHNIHVIQCRSMGFILQKCRRCMFTCRVNMFVTDSSAAFHTSLHSVIMCMKPDKTEGLDFAQMFLKLLTRHRRFRNRGQCVGACKACLPTLRAHRCRFLNPSPLGKIHLRLMSVHCVL